MPRSVHRFVLLSAVFGDAVAPLEAMFEGPRRVLIWKRRKMAELQRICATLVERGEVLGKESEFEVTGERSAERSAERVVYESRNDLVWIRQVI